MQQLAAYLLEVRNLSKEQVVERLGAINRSICEWLIQKGVSDPAANSGTFNSLTANGQGDFKREQAITEDGSLDEIRLEEYSRGGQKFTTLFQVVSKNAEVLVHANLSVTNTVSILAPVQTDPRCPSVIRKLLSLYQDWSLNGNPLGEGKVHSYFGEEGGSILVSQLTSEDRVLPLVVVSQNEGDTIWPRVDSELAFDLAGLAHVVTIDDEAAWILTDELGKQNSCYMGAVRLYWPVRRDKVGLVQFPGTVWTASALLSNDHDGRGMPRLRSSIRRKVMAVAALTVVPPKEVRVVKSGAARTRLQELEQRADANSEELEFARLHIEENENLRVELTQAKLENSALSARVEMAEYALSQIKSDDVDADSDSDSDSGVVTASTEPKGGETRYYKKMHSKPTHDVLVQVSDCGHSAWQSAAKADKAKKGVEKLEGKSNWKGIQHCGSCTGGGMWKVRW